MIRRFSLGFLCSLIGSFLFVTGAEARVLLDQSLTGTAYEIHPATTYGFYSKFPQYSGSGALFLGGGTPLTGTVSWLRVKRLAGVSCEAIRNVVLIGTDGGTQIGSVGAGIPVGSFCDFPVTGPNRDNPTVGAIFICTSTSCDYRGGELILDGSPDNPGFVVDGTQTRIEQGGWAFQLCDEGGCSGGFATADGNGTPNPGDSATTTPPTTSTTTATSSPPVTGTSTPPTTSTSTPPITSTSTATTTGPSSILFLPGIMGSRLYESGDAICGTSGEVELWYSFGEENCKQLRLKTTFTGESTNAVYTKASQEALVDEIFSNNLYKSFMDDLSDWKSDAVIADYRIVPYDWRLRIGDILKTKETSAGRVVYDPSIHYTDSYLYQSLSELVTTSESSVVLVTHSNGGLVAKAFLDYLEKQNDPLLPHISQLVLVGVPQAGTPEAIVGVLHGTALGGGWITSQEVSRTLLQTAPFGHHLLPSETYFTQSSAPVITFEPGVLTDGFIAEYGEAINERSELHRFLSDTKRVRPAPHELAVPSVLDSFLLDYANTAHAIQSAWQAPASMELHQIVGTGITTPLTLEYFTNYRCVERNIFKIFICSKKEPVLSYRVISSPVGDGTVVDWSAGMGDVNIKYVDLESYDSVFRTRRVHRDIFEVPDVRDFIKDTISDQSGSYSFIADLLPDTLESLFYTIHLHSPLDLRLVHEDGTIIGSTTPAHRGSSYTRFGEVQQLVIPVSEWDRVYIELQGYASGSFTLDVETWRALERVSRTQFSAIPSATSSVVRIMPAEQIKDLSLDIDYDGNGEQDVLISLSDSGELLYREPGFEADPGIGIRKTGSASVSLRPRGQVAGVAIHDGEYLRELYRLLNEVQKLLDLLAIIINK